MTLLVATLRVLLITATSMRDGDKIIMFIDALIASLSLTVLSMPQAYFDENKLLFTSVMRLLLSLKCGRKYALGLEVVKFSRDL